MISNSLEIYFDNCGFFVIETTLEAEDGDGDTITDGDSTTSNDIEFTFSGSTTAQQPDEITGRGFECSFVEGFEVVSLSLSFLVAIL